MSTVVLQLLSDRIVMPPSPLTFFEMDIRPPPRRNCLAGRTWDDTPTRWSPSLLRRQVARPVVGSRRSWSCFAHTSVAKHRPRSNGGQILCPVFFYTGQEPFKIRFSRPHSFNNEVVPSCILSLFYCHNRKPTTHLQIFVPLKAYICLQTQNQHGNIVHGFPSHHLSRVYADLLLVGDADGVVGVYRAGTTGEEVYRATAHSGAICGVQFAPDGRVCPVPSRWLLPARPTSFPGSRHRIAGPLGAAAGLVCFRLSSNPVRTATIC